MFFSYFDVFLALGMLFFLKSPYKSCLSAGRREFLDHKEDKRIPLAGGWLIFFSFLLKNNFSIFHILLFSFGLIGMVDDFIKIHKKGAFKIKYRLLLEFLASFVFIYFSLNNGGFIRFESFYFLNYLWGALVIISSANAFNLTDGVDGLAGFLGIFSCLFIYLVTGSFVSSALIGSLLLFLIFNFPFAKIYLGDLGSLSVGAVLGGLFLYYGLEFWYLLVGFMFVLETLSAIIQIFSIRMFNKKVFLMSPLHHHFELKGYSSLYITLAFALLSCVCLAFSLTLYYK